MRGCILPLLRKFPDTELLFGQFQVRIHDFPSIPRRIDANVTGVTEKWLPSSDILIVRCCTEGSGGDGGDGGDGGSGGGGNGGGGQCDGVMLFF